MKTKTGLWSSLEAFTMPSAVLAEWRQSLGGEFDKARVFLRPTQRQAESYPCTNVPPCYCLHEVRELDGGTKLWGVLEDDLVRCPPIHLQPSDVVIHEIDARKLCRAIRGVFKFNPATRGGVNGCARSHRIGNWGAAKSPVFLIIATDEPGMLKELGGLLSATPDPFIVLTPTDANYTPTVEGVLRRQRCVLIPVSFHLALRGVGQFTVTNPIEPELERFSQGLAEGKGLVKTVERLDRNVEAIAKGQYESQKEIEELHGLAADGFLNFIRSVEARDFCCFAFIMAYGDRAKAARELQMPERKFYERVDSWATRGSGYKRMFDLVRCRKKSLLKGTVSLGASLESGGVQNEAENPATIGAVLEQIRTGNLDQKDYPKILQEILDALADMNAKNWPAIRDEVMVIIREEVPQ